MTLHAADRLQFDFQGSLELAKMLWDLAEAVEARVVVAGAQSRATFAGEALVAWQGPFASDFRARSVDEADDGVRITAHLRDEAMAWASAWREAMDEQNRRNRAARVQQLREERGFLEQLWDGVWHGDDSEGQVPPVSPASTPQPPYFHATQQEMTF